MVMPEIIFTGMKNKCILALTLILYGSINQPYRFFNLHSNKGQSKMAKQVTANKIDNGNGKTVSLADFLNDHNLFDQLSHVDQATAKLVLQSIESAKNEGKKEVEKAMAAEKAAAEKAAADEQGAELKAIESDQFWLPKSGLFFKTMHDFVLTGIDMAINQSGFNPMPPEFPVSDKKGDVRSISRRVVALQFEGYWVEGHITINPGTKPAEMKRGRKAKTE